MVSLSHDARPAPPQPPQSWGGRAAAAPVALSGALLVLALAYLYAPLWQSCWKEWWREGSAYSHGILIPPLALLMV